VDEISVRDNKSVLVYFVHKLLVMLFSPQWFSISAGLLLTLLYSAFIFKIEKKEFQKLPVIGKYL